MRNKEGLLIGIIKIDEIRSGNSMTTHYNNAIIKINEIEVTIKCPNSRINSN